jgi:hypothetical protein
MVEKKDDIEEITRHLDPADRVQIELPASLPPQMMEDECHL